MASEKQTCPKDLTVHGQCFLTLMQSATDFIPSTDGLRVARGKSRFQQTQLSNPADQELWSNCCQHDHRHPHLIDSPKGFLLRALKCAITYDLVQAGNPRQGHLTLAPRVSWDLRTGPSEQSSGNHRNALLVRGVGSPVRTFLPHTRFALGKLPVFRLKAPNSA